MWCLWTLRIGRARQVRESELTLTETQVLCADARSQERLQRISHPFYLLHFTVLYLSKVKDLSIRGTNLQHRQKKEMQWEFMLSSPSTTASRQVSWWGDFYISLHSPHCARSKLAVLVASASCERIHWGFCSDANLLQLPPSCSHQTSRCTGYKQASGAMWAAPPDSDDPRLVKAVELVLTCTEQPEGRINYITSFSSSHKEKRIKLFMLTIPLTQMN